MGLMLNGLFRNISSGISEVVSQISSNYITESFGDSRRAYAIMNGTYLVTGVWMIEKSGIFSLIKQHLWQREPTDPQQSRLDNPKRRWAIGGAGICLVVVGATNIVLNLLSSEKKPVEEVISTTTSTSSEENSQHQLLLQTCKSTLKDFKGYAQQCPEMKTLTKNMKNFFLTCDNTPKIPGREQELGATLQLPIRMITISPNLPPGDQFFYLILQTVNLANSDRSKPSDPGSNDFNICQIDSSQNYAEAMVDLDWKSMRKTEEIIKSCVGLGPSSMREMEMSGSYTREQFFQKKATSMHFKLYEEIWKKKCSK